VPVGQTLFPHLGKMFAEDKERALSQVKKIFSLIVLLMFAVSIGFLLFGKYFLWILYSHKFDASLASLRILSFLPLTIAVSNVCGIQTMLNLRMDKEFLRITTIGAAVSFMLNFALVPSLHEIGTSITWVSTEILISTMMYTVLVRRGIHLFDWNVMKNLLMKVKHG
jgi:O-antigen/teichoic acid export membrane protein